MNKERDEEGWLQRGLKALVGWNSAEATSDRLICLASRQFLVGTTPEDQSWPSRYSIFTFRFNALENRIWKWHHEEEPMQSYVWCPTSSMYVSVRDFIDFLQHQHHLVTWSSRSISGCGICCFLLIVPKIWDVEMLLNFRASQFGEDLLIDTWKFMDRSQYPNLHPLAAWRMEKMEHRKRKSLQLWQQRKREKVWCVLDSFKCF